MLIRGGTSRGAYFQQQDLPTDIEARDALLVRVMGGPDALQVDGVGGGHPLTSKVAVLHPATDPEVDVDYLFLQVDPTNGSVSDAQNCGNILAGVGLYAIATGWVKPDSDRTTVRVRMKNTDALCHLELLTPNGEIQVEGDTVIDGVPGTGAPIVCNYLDIAGSACGDMLPTGNVIDQVDGIDVTCIDNGMPVVAIAADQLHVAGTEPPEVLDADNDLKAQLEQLRLQLGPRMNLGDVTHKSVPKMCIFSPPQRGGLVMTRTFIPHVCHKSIGVLGAVSAATACMLDGSAVAQLADVPAGTHKVVDVEHAAGSMQVQFQMDEAGRLISAGIVRTARILFRGEIFV